jgi:hypothetical protein
MQKLACQSVLRKALQILIIFPLCDHFKENNVGNDRPSILTIITFDTLPLQLTVHTQCELLREIMSCSSGLWHRVIWKVCLKVAEEEAISIWRLRDGCRMFLRDVVKHLGNYTMLSSRRRQYFMLRMLVCSVGRCYN